MTSVKGHVEKPETSIRNRNGNKNRNSNVKGNLYKNRDIIILPSTGNLFFTLMQFIRKITKLEWYHAPSWISIYYGNEKVKKAASLISKANALQVYLTFCQFLRHLCTTTTWNDQILSSFKKVNSKVINFLSELRCSLQPHFPTFKRLDNLDSCIQFWIIWIVWIRTWILACVV